MKLSKFGKRAKRFFGRIAISGVCGLFCRKVSKVALFAARCDVGLPKFQLFPKVNALEAGLACGHKSPVGAIQRSRGWPQIVNPVVARIPVGVVDFFRAIAIHINVSQPMRFISAAINQDLAVSILCNRPRNFSCSARAANWVNQPRKHTSVRGVSQNLLKSVLRDHDGIIPRLCTRGKE